ncbi:MAG: sulfite exporter TauE/SafE family protein [Chitinophagaceae bacterium]|nr:sulfite exporter TauE/SafE family protein [Chitinophagaceae bacterium]
MSGATIVLLILIGLAAGFLSGLIGIGGGVIIVPALVLLAGFSQKMAQGTSLGILLLPVGILGVIQYYKQGYLDIKFVVIISLAFVLGSLLGSKLALSLSDEKMKKIFAMVMLVIAVKMLFFDKSKPAPPKEEAVTATKIQHPDR